MYEKAIAKHKDSKINFLFGDSKIILKNLISTLKGPIIFWLDAHWSGGDTYGYKDECPLLDEIKIINSYHRSEVIFSF